MAKKTPQADELPAVEQTPQAVEVPVIATPTRAELDVALAALPGENDDPEYVVSGMSQYFGDLFTADDENTVRDIFSHLSAKEPETVEAFLLRDCVFGLACEVVTLSASDAAAGAGQGMLDLSEAAIAAGKAQ